MRSGKSGHMVFAVIGNIIEDADAPKRSGLAMQLQAALDCLTVHEATIMAMRLGLYDGEPHTLDEIGRALGVTRQRVHQIEKKARTKMSEFWPFSDNPDPNLIKLIHSSILDRRPDVRHELTLGARHWYQQATPSDRGTLGGVSEVSRRDSNPQPSDP